MIQGTLQRGVLLLALCASAAPVAAAAPAAAGCTPGHAITLIERGELAQAHLATQAWLARTDLSPEQEVAALTAELLRMQAASEWSGLDDLAPRVQAAARLPVAVDSRVRLLHALGATYSRSARFGETHQAFDTALGLAGDTPSAALLDLQRAKGAALAAPPRKRAWA